MTTIWNDIAITPMPIGGAAMVSLTVDQTTPVSLVRVIIGNHIPATATDISATDAVLDIPFPDGSGQMESPIWGALKTAGLSVTIFSQTGGVWAAGPFFAGVDLTPSFAPSFPWDADWLVDRLKDVANTSQPLPGKVVTITRAYPRDTHGWPAINAQVDSLSPMGSAIGDVLKTTISGGQTAYLKGRLYTLQVSMVAWCGTPEQRSALGKWMGGAVETVMDSARALGWEDPSASFRESEDFESLGVPAFLVTCNISTTVLATLEVTQRNSYRTPSQIPSTPTGAVAITLNAIMGLAGEPGITAKIPPMPGALISWNVINGYITDGQGTDTLTFALGEGHQTAYVNVTATYPGTYSGAGTAIVKILPQMESVTWATVPLAYQSEDYRTVDLGARWVISQMDASAPSRVRIYASQAQMAADTLRPVGIMPSSGSGLLAEATFVPGALSVPFKPWAYGNTTAPVWVLVDDMLTGSIQPITVTLTALRLE